MLIIYRVLLNYIIYIYIRYSYIIRTIIAYEDHVVLQMRCPVFPALFVSLPSFPIKRGRAEDYLMPGLTIDCKGQFSATMSSFLVGGSPSSSGMRRKDGAGKPLVMS